MSEKERPEPAAEALIKRLEEEKKILQGSEERFRRLVEETSDLVWEVDENGINTYMSPKIREVLGYEPEELIGRTPFEFMAPAEARFMAAVFKAIARAQRRFRFSSLVNINLHKNGHEIILETSAVPFFGPDGKLKGYRGIDRDITRRRKTEDELKKISLVHQGPLNKLKLQSGLLPLCFSCKRILTEEGSWESIEKYIEEHTEAEFSDSVCDECAKRLYSDKAA